MNEKEKVWQELQDIKKEIKIKENELKDLKIREEKLRNKYSYLTAPEDLEIFLDVN